MAEFYVSVEGNDAARGSRSRPFKNIAAAVEAVRSAKDRVHEPVTIFLRGGTHYQKSPIILGPDCSGSANAPVTLASYELEAPTISGGRRIAGTWRPYRDGIMMCSVPQARAGKLRFTQLFVNGKRQVRARYPNRDPGDPLKGYATAKGHVIEKLPRDETTDRTAWIRNRSEGARGVLFDPSTFSPRKWSKPDRAVLHIFPANRNANLQWQIRDIDRAGHVMWLGWGGFQRNTKMFPHGYDDIDATSRFFVENVFEELDAPGEWYLDEDNGTLYCMPEEGVDLAKAEVVVPVLKHVVELRGSQQDPVHDVTIRGVRIAHTASTFLEPYEILGWGDWSIHRGGAVFLEGTEACGVESCFFDAVGGNALFVNNYNRGVRILGNEFSEAGDSAVCLVGSDYLTLDGIDMSPSGCVVSNNHIHDCGIFGKQTAGVFSAVSRGNTISHNEIHRLPRAGICFNDGIGGGHLVEYNKVYDMVRETSDHGPFNSWGRERYWCLQHAQDADFNCPHDAGTVRGYSGETTVIRYNYFHTTNKMGAWGIDMDDGSCNYHVYKNLCVGVCIKLRDGDYRTVENNIIFFPLVPEDISVGYDGNHDKVRRNIIVTDQETYRIIWPPHNHPWFDLDYNVLYNPKQDFCADVQPRHGTRRSYTFAEWKGLGYDLHSVLADPLFVDPAKGDFRLRPDSPALALGFESFDTSTIGLLPGFSNRWRT